MTNPIAYLDESVSGWERSLYALSVRVPLGQSIVIVGVYAGSILVRRLGPEAGVKVERPQAPFSRGEDERP
jgi:hypothetical protein